MFPPRRGGIAVAIAWFVALTALAGWLVTTSDQGLRDQLTAAQFWSLEACVALGLVLLAALARDLVRGLGRADLARAAAVMGLAAALTLFVAPRTNRIFYDEHIYQAAGQSLADLKLAQVCHDGTVEYGRLQCWYGEYNKQPYGYPHLLSLAYRVVGVRPSVAFGLNAIVMALTAGAVYMLVWLLVNDRMAAFFAGLLVALTPQQIIWSATAAVEPSASLAAAAALVFAAHAARSERATALAGAAVALAYAVQFRPESLLIVPVAGLLMWPRVRQEFTGGRLGVWWMGLLFLALAAVHVGHLAAVRNVEWGTTDATFSLQYVADNLRVNGWFFLADERFPIAFTLLALAGFWRRGFRTERLTLLAYFLVFFGVGLLFYAGSYNYGADVRYSLLLVPPVAALGGLGAARLAAALSRNTVPLAGHLVVTAALLFQFLWYAPLVRATTEEAWAARADVRFARSFADELGPNTYVLTHNPGMFHVWGINAGQMSLPVRNPEYLDLLGARYANGVYIHWNFWCNVQDQAHPEICRKALLLKPVEFVREHHERDQRFAFYRVR
jgi:hypothetical protein